MQYKFDNNLSIQDFIAEFQIKVNRVKESGTVLSDGFLSYALLNAANLPEHKHALIKATCNKLTYKNVKQQLKKIGLDSPSSKASMLSQSSHGKPQT